MNFFGPNAVKHIRALGPQLLAEQRQAQAEQMLSEVAHLLNGAPTPLPWYSRWANKLGCVWSDIVFQFRFNDRWCDTSSRESPIPDGWELDNETHMNIVSAIVAGRTGMSIAEVRPILDEIDPALVDLVKTSADAAEALAYFVFEWGARLRRQSHYTGAKTIQ